jgi:hypothetical protein
LAFKAFLQLVRRLLRSYHSSLPAVTCNPQQAQVGRAAALGGRDLPGAGVREKSTQIAILEAFQLWQQADTDEQHQAALDLVMSRIQERFMKPVAVQQPKGEDAPI